MMNTSIIHHDKDKTTYELRRQYQGLFSQNSSEYGTADNISRKGCLALAKLGHLVWNQWRQDYPVTTKNENGKEVYQNVADFSGAVFEAYACFQHFEFGSGCRFRWVKFKDSADFTGSTFGESSSFRRVRFGMNSKDGEVQTVTNFQNSSFHDNSHFIDCVFYGKVDFFLAKFLNNQRHSITRLHRILFLAEAVFRKTTLISCLFYKVEFNGGHQVHFDNSEWASTEFCDTSFSCDVSFKETKFSQKIKLESVKFTKSVSFYDATFSGCGGFLLKGVEFKSGVSFEVCTWNGNLFLHMVFGSSAEFLGNEWHGEFDARSSNWHKTLTFKGDQFKSIFSLNGAQAYRIELVNCDLDGVADFSGLTPDEVLNVSDEKANSLIDDFSKKHGLSPKKFYEAVFEGCVFIGEADFRNREFANQAKWSKSDGENGRKTDFAVPPMFHGAKLPQDCSFVHAQFPKTASGKEEYERSYRTLRLALAQHGAIREEQRFFQLEMAEELARIKGKLRVRYWLIRLYSFFGYGFSVQRPLLALLVVLIAMMVSLGFGFENGFALNLDWDGVCNAFSRLSCAISTLVPLLGSPKSCKCWQTIPVLTEIFKFCGYTLTFLVGLALRNHLKMK